MSKKRKGKTLEELLHEALVPVEDQPYEVPENWLWLSFNAVVESISNKAKAIPQKEYEAEGPLPVIDQGQQLIAGYTTKLEHKFSGELPVIIFGDHTKCIKWVDFDFAQGADGTKLIKPKEMLDIKYLYYLLQFAKIPDKGYSRHFKYLRELVLPCPPLNEQKRITQKIELLLDKIKQAKQLVEEAQETFELRRVAILDQAFQGELLENNNVERKTVTLTSTKKLNIPAHWEVKTLKDSVNNFNNKRIPVSKNKREEIQGAIPYYGATGIVDYVNDYTHDGNFVLIGEDGANLLSRSKPQAFEASGKIWVNNHAHVISMKDEMDNRYLKHYLNYIPLNDFVTGTAQPKLNRNNLDKIPIPLPPVHEQNTISAKIDILLAKELDVVEKSYEILEHLFITEKSLLAKAFRGELGTNLSTEESVMELLTNHNS